MTTAKDEPKDEGEFKLPKLFRLWEQFEQRLKEKGKLDLFL